MMRSLLQLLAQTIPSRVIPSEKCASAVPHAERGSPAARRPIVSIERLRRSRPSEMSVMAPAITKNANPIPNGANTALVPSNAKVAASPTIATAHATSRRCATPYRSPRFHASSGPNGTATSKGTKSGPKVRLKNGAPTEILSPVSASSTSGYSVPTNTVAQAVAKNRLLNTSALSREIGANSPPCLSSGARQANSARLPPMNTIRITRMNRPRAGSVEKVWTDVNTPDRTRNVPINESEKVSIASRMVQTLSEFRFSITTAECNNAVPASQGISEAFSTGSQNHQPPQPSS